MCGGGGGGSLLGSCAMQAPLASRALTINAALRPTPQQRASPVRQANAERRAQSLARFGQTLPALPRPAGTVRSEVKCGRMLENVVCFRLLCFTLCAAAAAAAAAVAVAATSVLPPLPHNFSLFFSPFRCWPIYSG